MNLTILMKKQQHIKLLEKLFKAKASEKEIDEAYIAYKHFCYDNDLTDDIIYHNFVGDKLIISTSRNNTYIDSDEVAQSVDKLVESFKSNLQFGISSKEADIILRWVVQNARQAALCNGEVQTASYMQTCDYFVQILTALPFIDKGIYITINDVKKFNGDFNSHGFITVNLPIQENEKVILKKFLVDVFYARFFTYERATAGLFYESKKELVGPSAGFYVCKMPLGIEFAQKLINDGYIELTIDNARIYGAGFECEKLNITNYNDWKEIMSKSGQYYLDIIENNQEVLSHNGDSVELYDADTKFPTLSKIKK